MTFEVAADLKLGSVHLTVADLRRSIDFYEAAVGLRVREQPNGSDTHEPFGAVAALGVNGADLLVLHESPGARPSVGFSGLFHFALLVPERKDLAGWLRHAMDKGVRITGAADHFVSEAIYLDDPDGHGIEIYWDRPRAVWEGRVAEQMTSLPLDFEDLLLEPERTGGGRAGPEAGARAGDGAADRTGTGVTEEAGAVEEAEEGPEAGEGSVMPDGGAFELPAGTTMGHVHLRVADIATTIDFYRDVLGFELMATFGARAAFFGAGGYHHHVGANTWGSAGAGQAPDGFAALRFMTMDFPDRVALERVVERAAAAGYPATQIEDGLRVRDPSGNGVLLAVRGAPGIVVGVA